MFQTTFFYFNFSEAYRKADTDSRNWGTGGSNSRALNAAALIGGTLGGQSNLQTAANTLAPYAAAAIGRRYGHGDNKNAAAQAVGHLVLGATLAYINGGDPIAGGSAALAAEKAAEYLGSRYNDGKTAIDPQTGEFDPNLLPEEVKEEIKATTGAIAALVGATGDNGAGLNAQIAGVVGQNAVGNNWWLTPQEKSNISNSFNFAQQSLKAHQGDVDLMMKDLETYNTCRGCKTDGHRYTEFLVEASSQVGLTIVSGGVSHVIRGEKAARYLNTLRKWAKSETATTFVINGVANAAVNAAFDKSQRSLDNVTYNVVVGGTAGYAASKMNTVRRSSAMQGAVYGLGEAARNMVYKDGEKPPSTGEVAVKTAIAVTGGTLGGVAGSKSTRYVPNSSHTVKTTVDAVTGSTVSAVFGKVSQPNIEKNKK